MDADSPCKGSEHDDNIQDAPFLCSQRWILGYLGFLLGMVFSILRMDINIAIVCMAGDVIDNVTEHVNISTKHDGISHHVHNVTDVNEACEAEYRTIHNTTRTPEFTWDRTTQSHILSAYYYGFVALQIPCSWFVGKFGGKAVVIVFTTVASLTTLLIPVLARTSVYAVLVARIIVGIASAPLPAAWISMVGIWALPNERSRMMTVFWLGQTIGAVICFSTSGWLCVYGFDNGWGSIFYAHGIVGICFVVLWMYFTASSPEAHPRITESEKRLLSQQYHAKKTDPGEFFNVPWKKVFTTLSVWAIFVTHFCDNVMYFLIVVCLPLFVKEILRFDIQSNGVFSALPNLTTAASLVSSAVIADYINNKRLVSRTTNRKIFQLTSFLVSSAFLVLSSYMSCDQRHIVILLLCLCTFFQSVALSAGYPCNLVDMTPRYASYLYSVSNAIGASAGFLVPLIIAYLTQQKTIQEWRFVFWLTAGVSVIGSIVYGLFSTSEHVSWDTSGTREVELTVEEKDPFINVTHAIGMDTKIVTGRDVVNAESVDSDNGQLQ